MGSTGLGSKETIGGWVPGSGAGFRCCRGAIRVGQVGGPGAPGMPAGICRGEHGRRALIVNLFDILVKLNI